MEGAPDTRFARNLLIVHTPHVEDIADWREVQALVAAHAPEIETRIVNNRLPNDAVSRWQATRPSLVFSPHELRNFRPLGGKVYAGQAYDKIVQHDRLAAAGVPTVPTAFLAEGFVPPAAWGDLLVVKPINGKHGADVHLVHADEVTRRVGELTDDGRKAMIVQPFIEHVDGEGRPSDFRVLLAFGRLVYAARNRWSVPRPPIDQPADALPPIITSNSLKHGRLVRELTSDETVLRIARNAAAAFPEIPVLAVDIIRATQTGAHVVLEVNPRGESWHLSSTFAKRTFAPEHRADLYRQYGALDVMADALIEKTRAEAC